MSHAHALKHLKKSDPRLKDLIQKVGSPTLKPEPGVSPYAALVESVVYQQLHGNAARAIFSRFLALYHAKEVPPPRQVLDTACETLRGCGLSLSKVETIRRIAEATLQGVIPSAKEAHALSDEELLERMTSIKGIGPWTVQMFLIFTLGRPDVLPSTDFGVRHGFKLLYRKREMPKPRSLESYAERWKPYRSLASWYLWRAVDLLKPKTKPKAKAQPKKKAILKR